MRSSHVCGRTLATSLIAFGVMLAVVPNASADPADDAAQTEAPPAGPAVMAAPVAGDASPEATDACKQFASALNFASVNYEDFAYSIAGDGANVNYADPNVTSNNVAGRTALRQSAAAAMDAANTPGLQPQVADPMRAWSLTATKLLVIMGIHGNGDALNSTATELNNEARDAQMACALAGTHA
ncbi:MAG: hypothetical protein JWR37_331 [Mycobacterium sp.]|nr:hypothetical protein [Mycobacterium sp.]